MVEERVADGRELVRGHDSQEQTLCSTMESHEGHLDCIAYKGDGLAWDEEAFQQARAFHHGKGGFYEGEDTQEEVHGCVELWALLGQGDHAQVAHEGGWVDE